MSVEQWKAHSWIGWKNLWKGSQRESTVYYTLLLIRDDDDDDKIYLPLVINTYKIVSYIQTK